MSFAYDPDMQVRCVFVMRHSDKLNLLTEGMHYVCKDKRALVQLRRQRERWSGHPAMHRKGTAVSQSRSAGDFEFMRAR